MKTPPITYLLFRKAWATRQQGIDGQGFRHYKSLQFAALFDDRHRAKFDPGNKSGDAAVFADMWASVYAHLIINKHASPGLLRDAIYCCESILADLGFTHLSAIRDLTMVPGSRVSMLVPGCQTHKTLRNRAVVAADVYHRLSRTGFPTVCLLSGARPGDAPRVQISNESALLRRHFVEHLSWLQGKHVQDLDLENGLIARDLAADADAKVTTANMKAFVKELRKEFVKSTPMKDGQDAGSVNKDDQGTGAACSDDGERTKPRLIVLVSSTFHLIRMAETLEQQLTEMAADNEIKLPEKLEILLVGAENVEGIDSPETSPTVWNQSYVKSMFFEIFNYLAKKGLMPPFEAAPAKVHPAPTPSLNIERSSTTEAITHE